MNRVKITADGLLQIVTGLFDKCDYTIDDKLSALDGKRMTEVLNIEYYTFKKRLQPASDYIESMEKSLQRSFCLVELTNVERLYSKDLDYVSVDGKLTLWLQSYKVKLLESFIETCNRALCGEVVSTVVNGEERAMLFSFGRPEVISSDAHSEIGDSVIIEIALGAEIAPGINSYNEYKLEFKFDDEDTFLVVPYTSWIYSYNTSQTAIPCANKSDSGFINVTQSNNISLTLYDFNSELTKKLRDIAFYCNALGIEDAEINKEIVLRIAVSDYSWQYSMIVKSITFNFINSTFNTINLVLTPRS